MTKFCGNCGAAMDNDARICGNCGTYLGEVDNVTAPAVGRHKKLLPVVIVAIVAVVVALAVSLLSVLGVVGYKKAVNNVLDVIARGKVTENKIEALAPKDVWEYFEDEEDLDPDDAVDYFEEAAEDSADYLEEEYGDNWRVSYKIKDKDQIKDSKLKKIARTLHDKYDIKKSSVKKGFDLELEVKIKGSEDEDEDDLEFAVLKIGGKWYAINYEIDGDECEYVSFMLDVIA